MKSSLQAKVDDYKRQEAMIKDESTKQQKQRALLEEEQKSNNTIRKNLATKVNLLFKEKK